jgi:RimJ/RimL family protein N-acetyltransferase
MPADTLDAIRLETERLLLRPPVPEDAHAAAALLGDLEAMRFIGSGTVAPPEAVGEVVERWRLRWDDNGIGPFVVERRSDGPGRALRQLSGSQRPAERDRDCRRSRHLGRGRCALTAFGWSQSRIVASISR